MKAPLKRFSGRVDNYVKYRAAFPDTLVDFLVADCGLTPDSIIADLGSGTGTLTKMLLDHGNSAFAIEPNAEMRIMAERLLGGYDGFHSVDATAEATTLSAASIDIVTVGRALQWFDAPVALREMSRILKPGGWAVIIWNRRKQPGTPQLSAYRDILQTYCNEYEAKNRRRRDAIDLLLRLGFKLRTLEHQQELDLEQLKGLVSSLSISPDKGSASYEPLMVALEKMFAKHQVNGHLLFDYTTMAYYGSPAS
jgi:ubiquinone/menaquinone biosynthesis C-methylase UbiE